MFRNRGLPRLPPRSGTLLSFPPPPTIKRKSHNGNRGKRKQISRIQFAAGRLFSSPRRFATPRPQDKRGYLAPTRPPARPPTHPMPISPNYPLTTRPLGGPLNSAPPPRLGGVSRHLEVAKTRFARNDAVKTRKDVARAQRYVLNSRKRRLGVNVV